MRKHDRRRVALLIMTLCDAIFVLSQPSVVLVNEEWELKVVVDRVKMSPSPLSHHFAVTACRQVVVCVGSLHLHLHRTVDHH